MAAAACLDADEQGGAERTQRGRSARSAAAEGKRGMRLSLLAARDR